MRPAAPALHGGGLGLRRALLAPLQNWQAERDGAIDFFEIAPENWLGVGGRLGKSLRALSERHAFSCHGLSLSLGGAAPLDETLLRRIRRFLREHGIARYSEHLSYCADEGQLYELLPIPYTEAAVRHVAARIRRAQDILGQRIAIENVSCYATPGREMSEAQFTRAVLDEADCDLLLDVNNVHVNSIDHGYDACAFIESMPAARIVQMHIAGHDVQAPDLLIDSHAAPVAGPVWQLLDCAYAHCGVKPTLLERDFRIPPLGDLLGELDHIRRIQMKFASPGTPGPQGQSVPTSIRTHRPDPSGLAATQALQHRFCAHLRDPDRTPPPHAVPPQRMAIYRELLRINIEGFLASNFPVLRSLYGDDDWRGFVRAFLREHRCRTPLFPEFGGEVLHWLQARRNDDDPPFLRELAHYEWAQSALALTDTDLTDTPHDAGADPRTGVPVVSPLAQVFVYRYPVHRIGPDFRPREPPADPTVLLLVRGRDDAVRRHTISALGALLLEALRDNNAAFDGRQCLDALLARQYGPAAAPALRDEGLALLVELQRRQAILGTR